MSRYLWVSDSGSEKLRWYPAFPCWSVNCLCPWKTTQLEKIVQFHYAKIWWKAAKICKFQFITKFKQTSTSWYKRRYPHNYAGISFISMILQLCFCCGFYAKEKTEATDHKSSIDQLLWKNGKYQQLCPF